MKIIVMVFHILKHVHLFHYIATLTDLHLIFMKFYGLYHMDHPRFHSLLLTAFRHRLENYVHK